MIKGWKELVRFSTNGKTFFFNRAQTAAGKPYLQINSLQGTRKESLNVFEEMLLPFLGATQKAVESMAALRFEKQVSPTLTCNACKSTDLKPLTDDTCWVIYCNACHELVWESEEGAADAIQAGLSSDD